MKLHHLGPSHWPKNGSGQWSVQGQDEPVSKSQVREQRSLGTAARTRRTKEYLKKLQMMLYSILRRNSNVSAPLFNLPNGSARPRRWNPYGRSYGGGGRSYPKRHQTRGKRSLEQLRRKYKGIPSLYYLAYLKSLGMLFSHSSLSTKMIDYVENALACAGSCYMMYTVMTY